MDYNDHVILKVVSYNIHKGFDPFNKTYILSDIRNLIRQTGADLVCLQEVVGKNDKFKTNGNIDNQIEFLAEDFLSVD